MGLRARHLYDAKTQSAATLNNGGYQPPTSKTPGPNRSATLNNRGYQSPHL